MDECKKLREQIEKEKLKCSSLQNDISAINFRKLQNGAKTLRTVEEFAIKNVRDLSFYMNDNYSAKQTKKVDKLQQLVDSSVAVTGVQVESINRSSENGLPQYILTCKLQDNSQMEITLACPSLDNLEEMQLMEVVVGNQDGNLKEFISMCCRINNVPILIQGIGKYFQMKEQRHQLIQNLHHQYGKKMLIWEKNSGDASEMILQLVNPNTGKKVAQFHWVIAYDSQIMSFSFAFRVSSDASGVWLRRDHTDLLDAIVNSKNMNTTMEESWSQLCALVKNRKE